MMHRHAILLESSRVTSKKPAHKEQHKALYCTSSIVFIVGLGWLNVLGSWIT